MKIDKSVGFTVNKIRYNYCYSYDDRNKFNIIASKVFKEGVTEKFITDIPAPDNIHIMSYNDIAFYCTGYMSAFNDLKSDTTLKDAKQLGYTEGYGDGVDYIRNGIKDLLLID